MGFGGQQGTLQPPVYIPIECELESVGSILTSGPSTKAKIQTALLQHGCTQEDIDIMLEYVFIELLALDFESIATENHIFFTDPISSLRFLAKERHEAYVTHVERLEETRIFLSGYTHAEIYAITQSADFEEKYRAFLECSPTGKKLTKEQCRNVALHAVLLKNIGIDDLTQRGYKPLPSIAECSPAKEFIVKKKIFIQAQTYAIKGTAQEQIEALKVQGFTHLAILAKAICKPNDRTGFGLAEVGKVLFPHLEIEDKDLRKKVQRLLEQADEEFSITIE